MPRYRRLQRVLSDYSNSSSDPSGEVQSLSGVEDEGNLELSNR